jgi:FMN phosphatase YigB (HAD superfamily)
MTRAEIEAFNKIADQIGAGLDALCDLLVSIEEAGKRKPAPAKTSQKKGK